MVRFVKSSSGPVHFVKVSSALNTSRPSERTNARHHMDHLVPQAVGTTWATLSHKLTEAEFARMRLCSRRRALVLAARNFWSGNFITQFVRGGERLPLTEARRVLVLPSLNPLTEASRGGRRGACFRDEAQCSIT